MHNPMNGPYGGAIFTAIGVIVILYFFGGHH